MNVMHKGAADARHAAAGQARARLVNPPCPHDAVGVVELARDGEGPVQRKCMQCGQILAPTPRQDVAARMEAERARHAAAMRGLEAEAEALKKPQGRPRKPQHGANNGR